MFNTWKMWDNPTDTCLRIAQVSEDFVGVQVQNAQLLKDNFPHSRDNTFLMKMNWIIALWSV